MAICLTVGLELSEPGDVSKGYLTEGSGFPSSLNGSLVASSLVVRGRTSPPPPKSLLRPCLTIDSPILGEISTAPVEVGAAARVLHFNRWFL